MNKIFHTYSSMSTVVCSAFLLCMIGLNCLSPSDCIYPNGLPIERGNYNDSENQQYTCLFLDDTLYQNVNLKYNEAMGRLVKHLDSIEVLALNTTTKTYLKCLSVASFTSSIFSHQFLGNKIGLSSHNIAVPNWQNKNIEQCYNYGNTNKTTVWCGDRTTFFTKLLDSLLNIKAEALSIKNIHTYPIVTIQNKSYIIDPYDLFVAVDTVKNTVLDYQSIKDKNYKSITIYNVKNPFGKSVELISNGFYKHLLKNYYESDSSICALLNNYFLKEKDNLLNNTNVCKPLTVVQQHTKILPVCGPDDKFAIVSDYKISSIKYDIPNFYRQYFGFKCN